MTTATARRATTVRAPARQKSATPRTPNRRTTTSTSETKRTAAAYTSRRPRPSADVTGQDAPKKPVRHAALAAERAVRRNSLRLQLPVVGELTLPSPEQVAFIGGVVVLAVIGVLEWPVAALLGAGHALATRSHAKMVRAFGEALEEA